MISTIGNLMDAIAGFLQPLMNLNKAIYDFAALLQRLLSGPFALWAQLMNFLQSLGF